MTCTFFPSLAIAVLLMFTTGCGATIKRTDLLVPGMTTAQVRQVWGDPEQIDTDGDMRHWHYSTFDLRAGGNTPVIVTFDAPTDTMDHWSNKWRMVNREIYAQMQDQELIRRATMATPSSLIAALPLGHFFVDSSGGDYTPSSSYSYRPNYKYTAKTTVKHHKDGRTTYKTKVRRKY